jgi:hypothetical protein
MRRFWGTWWWRIVSTFLPLLCLAALLVCCHFRIWSFEDYRVYQEVCRYPVGEDLWFGRIQAGQNLEHFLAEHPPHRTLRLGRFTDLSYYTLWPLPPGTIPLGGLAVIAKDGRLVQAAAGCCTWQRVFFAMSAEDEEELSQAFHVYVQELHKRNNKK